MTPHEKELIKKLDKEIKKLSIEMKRREEDDSLTLKEIRHYLYLLTKDVKIVKHPPFNLDECINPSSKDLPTDLFPPKP